MNKQDLKIPDLPGVSLVAYYRDKPSKLSLLVLSIQHELKQIYGGDFIPYDLAQVHGTIMGCEGLLTSQGIINKWFYQQRNQVKYSDWAGLLAYLKETDLLPLQIRFSGYQQDFDYQFLSRGKHPRDRCFQLQTTHNNQLIPILLGWSINKQKITTNFQQIRYNCQQYNFLHKYHQKVLDIDNDFYLRLGTVTNSVNFKKKLEAEKIVTNYLQRTAPILIKLRRQNLALVKYQDILLPLHSTDYFPLEKISWNDNFINFLYQ